VKKNTPKAAAVKDAEDKLSAAEQKVLDGEKGGNAAAIKQAEKERDAAQKAADKAAKDADEEEVATRYSSALRRLRGARGRLLADQRRSQEYQKRLGRVTSDDILSKALLDIDKKIEEELNKVTASGNIALVFVPGLGGELALGPGLGLSGEVLGFAGGTWASSFGSNFNTSSAGGRGAAAIALGGPYWAQLDMQGSATGSYCTPCGTSSNVAGGAHLNVRLGSADVGVFGGFQEVNPPFMVPSSTNGFGGVEFRNSFNNWALVGFQVGYYSDVSGPGTLTNAAFVEGRAKFALGPALNYPGFGGASLGLRLGYAEGSLGHSSINANTFSWGATYSYPLTLGPPAIPLTLFVSYDGFQNRTATAGTVWNENMLKGGVKIDFGGPPIRALEPTSPLPLGILQSNYKF
jgi:hypothetical protein